MQLLSSLVLVSVALCASQVQALSSLGTTVTLGNVSYFVPPTPAARLSLSRSSESVSLQKSGQALVPFTFVSSSSRSFSTSDLAEVSKKNGASDDVWSSEFLAGVYVSSKATPKVSGGKTTKFILSSSKTPVKPSLPSGPYFVDPSTGEVFQAWRLYNDENQSFLYGTQPDGSGGYKQMSAHVEGPATESVAVPSRLYFTPTAEKPLAGKRLAVKDIYDVKGLRTGCGNRAYYHLYPEKNTTAPAIQRLLDGGAILVGKVKTSQFANGETATADWVDYHAPYNPRGDGYQDGSSSSTGSGTAIASYPWLDYAVGSDTGGSMRGPSGVNGVFGNRPSHGAVALDHVMPLSPSLDTAGIFSRDAKTWKAVGDWWYANYTKYDKYPKKILFPVDTWGSSFLSAPPANGTAGAVFNTFIQKLEVFLNTTRTEFNLTNTWANTSPLIANVSNPPPPLAQLLNTTYADYITLDQISLLADPFIADYKAAHGGRTPFINPAPSTRWAYGRTLDATAKRVEMVSNKTVFMNWFQGTVLEGKNASTCANSIFLYPQSQGRTNYRNQYNALPGPPMGFSAGRIAVFGEVPDMVVPIGEIAYNSTISMTTEYLPVTVSFITQKGCDLMLFSLIAALQDAGIISPVGTGSRLFSS